MAISELLDNLSCELLGEAFDQLAEGKNLGVVASVCDASGKRLTCAFEADFTDSCLEMAREWVRTGAHEESGSAAVDAPQCYAIVYRGAVGEEAETDSFSDAVILEFGEKGNQSAWSAYSFIEGVGRGDDFRYTDPEPAGETPNLL